MAIHHRPGFDDLRDILRRWGLGTRLHGHEGLTLAAGTGDVLMAGEGQLGAPPTSCVRRWGGCARRGQGTTSRCGPKRLLTHESPPAAGMSASHHRPPECVAVSSIPEQVWTPTMDGGRRRCGRNQLHCSPHRRSPRPVPSWPSSPATAITASSPTGTGKPWHWRPTRRGERHPRPQVRPISPRAASPPTAPGWRCRWRHAGRRASVWASIVTTKTLRPASFPPEGSPASLCICGPGKPSVAPSLDSELPLPSWSSRH